MPLLQIEAGGLPLTPEALAALPPFSSITFNVEEFNGQNCKPEVAKTGLGSSAAMTTAVVAALLHYLGSIDLSSCCKENQSSNLDMVHIIAQTAHCIAQGKVGSGLDVSSALYGSHFYMSLSPEVISSTQVCASPLCVYARPCMHDAKKKGFVFYYCFIIFTKRLHNDSMILTKMKR